MAMKILKLRMIYICFLYNSIEQYCPRRKFEISTLSKCYIPSKNKK